MRDVTTVSLVKVLSVYSCGRRTPPPPPAQLKRVSVFLQITTFLCPGRSQKVLFRKRMKRMISSQSHFLLLSSPPTCFPSAGLPGSGGGFMFVSLAVTCMPFWLCTCKPRHLPPDMLQCPARIFVPREATEGKSQIEADSRTSSFLAQLTAGPPEFEKE